MRRLFDNYVIVDWSASAKPTTGSDSIWIGVYARDVRLKLQYSESNPATRHAAEQEMMGLLAEFAGKGQQTLVGFDFPLGYPTGTASALSLKETPWEAMHRFLAKEVKDKPTNDNNRFIVASMMNRRISGEAFPFWGCPAKNVTTTLQATKARPHGSDDLPERRVCEAVVKGASPVWKLYTVGSVGSQALTGIPTVARLREAIPNSQIWPFELGWQPLDRTALYGIDVVFAEVYPSMIPAKAQPGRPKDAVQVEQLAKHFAELDEAFQLAALFGPPKTTSDEVIKQVQTEEGWILGAQ